MTLYSPTSGTVAAQIDPNGGRIEYEYDLFGNVTRVKDERNNSTLYKYDYKGRMTTETNPLGKSRWVVWDDGADSGGCASCGSATEGRVIRARDFSGRRVEFDYLATGAKQLWRTRWMAAPTGSTVEESVSMTFDSWGRVASVTDSAVDTNIWGSQTWSYAYANDRLTTVTWPDSAKIVFGHDSYGRRTTVTDPDGNVTAYSYANTSTNKGLSSVAHSVAGSQGLGTIAFNRDTRGRLSSLTGPYGMTQEWNYDSHSRNTGFTVSSYMTGGASSPLHAESYTYDALDRRTRVDYPVQTGAGGATAASRREWGYNAAGRLVREDRFGGGGTGSGTARTYGRVWGYDNAGNRSQELFFDGSTTSTDSAPTFNVWNQRTADGREGAFAWDDEGNLTLKALTEHTFFWDRRNRLVEVQGYLPRLDWSSVYYGYDPSGRLINRVAKDPQDTEFGWYDEKRYYADGLSPILVKRRHRNYGESPAVIQPWHTWKAALIIPGAIGHVAAERETTAWNPSSGATTTFTDRYYHYDPLGNCVLETGAGAVVLARTDMEAYGEMVRESDASGNWAVASSSVGPTGDVGAGSRPRQTTKETDPDTGLRWFGARWYDPQLGSWLSASSVKLIFERPFVFCSASPSFYADSDGYVTGDAVQSAGKYCEKKMGCREGEKDKQPIKGDSCFSFACCIMLQLFPRPDMIPPSVPQPPPTGPLSAQNYPPGTLICYGTGGSANQCTPQSTCNSALGGSGKQAGFDHVGVVGNNNSFWQCGESKDPRNTPKIPDVSGKDGQHKPIGTWTP